MASRFMPAGRPRTLAVVEKVRQLDEPFHALIRKEIAGTATVDEIDRLNMLCAMKSEEPETPRERRVGNGSPANQ